MLVSCLHHTHVVCVEETHRDEGGTYLAVEFRLAREKNGVAARVLPDEFWGPVRPSKQLWDHVLPIEHHAKHRISTRWVDGSLQTGSPDLEAMSNQTIQREISNISDQSGSAYMWLDRKQGKSPCLRLSGLSLGSFRLESMNHGFNATNTR